MSLILPHLTYAITIWGTDKINATYIQPLHRLQKKILRIITRSPPMTPTQPIRQQLHIMTVFQLYEYRSALIMQPFIYPPEEKQPTLTQPIPHKPEHKPHHNAHFTFRHQDHTISDRYTTRKTLKATSITPHSTKLFIAVWNQLPYNITNIKNFTTFKKSLRTLLLTNNENDDLLP